MSWRRVKLNEILKQYRIEHRVQDDKLYKQVSIFNNGSVVLRGEKIGKEIGRKRQFIIDIDKFPNTLIFTRQLLLQGSIGIANGGVNKCIVTENMPMFSITDSKVDVKFLTLFLKSELFRKQVRKVELTGSAQKSIHEKSFLELDIPLPSIDEQRKIVKTFSAFNTQNLTLTNEFSYQQVLLKQLRQSFLREAMQGKILSESELTGLKDEQDYETGQQLLERIKKEKNLANPKIKKILIPTIKEEEIPFVGPPLGKIAIIPDDLPECNFNQAAVLIRPMIKEMNKFVFWYLNEMSEINSIETKGVAGQNNISVTQAHNMRIPLPPLAEQNRIIKKLEELMKLCDDLQASIQASKEQNEMLLQGALRDALKKEVVEIV